MLLSGCGLSPEAKIEAMAHRAGLTAGDVQAGPFSLRFFLNDAQPRAAVVNVYLEGDGSPWTTPRLVARNPTPRNPLALKLMQQDPNRALYLSRPCYQGRQNEFPCEPWLWTHGRYSKQVVQSLSNGIDTLVQKYAPDAKIRLIGHSGGGVLAMLIAERLAKVIEVITLAANLDIDAWADHFNYSRLAGSLNPVTRSGLTASVAHIHLVGGRDKQVPALLTIGATEGLPNTWLVVVEEFDHHCCWVALWSRFLEATENLSALCEKKTMAGLKVSCEF